MTLRSATRISGGFAAVLAVLGVLAGCTDSEPATPTTTTTTSTSRTPPPTPPDEGLRPVKIPYGDGIAFVLHETAAQVLCQALSATEWKDAMGGEVGRRVDASSVDGTCVLISGWLEVSLSLRVLDLASVGPEVERIAGRSVRLDVNPSGSSAYAGAAVVPLGEQNVPAQQRVLAHPVLYVSAQMKGLETNPHLGELVRRLLGAVLPKLTHEGPPTPAYDGAGDLPYTPTEPIPGVQLADLPPTVQSLVLCTAALKELKRKPNPEKVLLNAVGECQISGPEGIFIEVDRFGGPVPNGFTIANHRAYVGGRGVEIHLLDMKSRNSRTYYLTLRLNRKDLDLDAKRAWAEKVAAPLLAT